jgi:hypothetical protein
MFSGERKFNILDIKYRDFSKKVESKVFVGLKESRVFIEVWLITHKSI